jgi:hypothetical protein
VPSEVCGFSAGNMRRAADLQKTQVCATHSMHNSPAARGLVAQPGDRPSPRRAGAILLPGGQFRSGDGSDAVNPGRRRLAPGHQRRRHTRQRLRHPPRDCAACADSHDFSTTLCGVAGQFVVEAALCRHLVRQLTDKIAATRQTHLAIPPDG